MFLELEVQLAFAGRAQCILLADQHLIHNQPTPVATSCTPSCPPASDRGYSLPSSEGSPIRSRPYVIDAFEGAAPRGRVTAISR
jgi:hypothetical protein